MTLKHTGDSKELTQILGNLGDNGFHSAWSNPEKFFRHIASLDKSKAWTNSGWDSDARFTGSKSMDEALKIATDGWKEGIARIERIRNRIAAMHPKKAIPIKYGIAGVTPSIPRAVAGNIFNMRAPDLRKSKRRPVITLVSNMACNWTVNAEALGNRAAVVAALVDEIESAGYSVEVVSTATTKNGTFKSAVSVIVKKSDQFSDLSRLSFAMGHPSMFRRMVFAEWGSEKSCKEGLGLGLGYHLSFTPTEEDAFNGNFYVPSAEHSSKLFKDEETAGTKGLEFLKQQLAKQGCPAFKDLYTPEFLEEIELASG